MGKKLSISGIEGVATYNELGDEPENPWRYPTHAAIGPLGQIAIRHLTPGKDGAIGDVPIRTEEGFPFLSPRYAANGWVMYEDLCKGRVPGIKKDIDAWKRWEALIRLNAEGRIIPAEILGDQMWHPEVVRRRQDGGVTPRLTVAELRQLFPGVTIEEAEDAEAAEAEG